MSFNDFLEAFWARHPDWGGPVKSGEVAVPHPKPAGTPTKANPGASGGVLALGSDAGLDQGPDMDGIEPEGLDSGPEIEDAEVVGVADDAIFEDDDCPSKDWWDR